MRAWVQRRGIRRPGVRFGFLGVYLLAALALTLPVWRDPAALFPGSPGDPMQSMNFLGWYPFALTHGLNPLLDTYVNLPQGSSLMWNTSFPLLALAMWPVTALFGVVVSYNVALVLALTFDGWCTFLWLRRHVAHPVAAGLGGLLMVLGPYASMQATAHLHLMLFFLVPLLLIAVETVIRHPDHSHLKWGCVIGLLAAAQVLLAEEILALFVVVVGTTLVIGALISPRSVRERIRPLVRTAAVAAVVFLVVCGVPLGYQFFGPGRAVGLLQPSGTYVTDLANLFFPNAHTLLAPGFATRLAGHWTAGPLESESYVGIPLLLMCFWTFRRPRGDRWLVVVGCGLAAAVVWSLGPSLHVDGVTLSAIPLPGRLFADLPALKNILPSRFALFIDLGLAVVIAVFTDRTVLQGTRRARVAGAMALLVVCATLVPCMPLPAWNAATPAYFLTGGDVAQLPSSTAALLVPFGAYNEATLEPTLWQAQSGFRVRVVSGGIVTAGQYGVSVGLPSLIQLEQHPWGLPASAPPRSGVVGTTLACVMDALESWFPTGQCGPDIVGASRGDLQALHVTVIIMGPMAYGTDPALQRPVENFLDQVAGGPPRSDQGVLVWNLPG